MKKDTYIRVRCSTADKELIKKVCVNRNITMSEYMLTAVKTQITKEGFNQCSQR